MKLHAYALSFLAFALVVVPSAAGAVSLFDTLGVINAIINAFIPIIISLALVVFFWGLIKYLLNINQGAEERNEGIQIMIWGVVAIFVMVSIWGIIRLLQSTFKVTSTDPIVPKTIQLGR